MPARRRAKCFVYVIPLRHCGWADGPTSWWASLIGTSRIALTGKHARHGAGASIAPRATHWPPLLRPMPGAGCGGQASAKDGQVGVHLCRGCVSLTGARITLSRPAKSNEKPCRMPHRPHRGHSTSYRSDDASDSVTRCPQPGHCLAVGLSSFISRSLTGK